MPRNVLPILLIVLSTQLEAAEWPLTRTTAAELAAAESLWERSAIQSYSYVFRIANQSGDYECATQGLIKVVVKNGRTAEYGTCAVDSAPAISYGSVSALFHMLREAAAARVPELSVDFDREVGVPTMIHINYDKSVSERAVQYYVSQLTRGN